MKGNEGKYNIKAISTMLGIQAGTLRAWERRYKIIEPIRNQAGHRLYSDEHVAILRWLIDKVNKGFTIGQAVGLLEKGNISFTERVNQSKEDYSSQLSDEILACLLKFQEVKANELLNKAFSLYSIEKVTIDILGQLLVKVGQMWENEEINVAHEHYISAFLRTKIGNVFYGFPIDAYLPKVVAVCGPNEKHELGLLIFMLFLRQRGFEVIYLGAGIPETDVEFVINEVDPKFFFTSCTLDTNLHQTLLLIDRLSEKYNDVVFGVGGRALTKLNPEENERYKKFQVGDCKSSWEDWLSNYIIL